MVGAPLRIGAVLFLVMILSEGATGQDSSEAPVAGGVNEALSSGDLEEVEEVLRTLDAAGVPPTQEELARFLRAQESGAPHGAGTAKPSWFAGALYYRVGQYPREGLDHYGKISLEIPWLRLRGRIREYRTGMREASGAAELGLGPVDLAAGHLGLSHGHGLLVGAPGRGSSLAADSGFRPAAERMVTWLGSDDPRAVPGFGGSLRAGPWSLRFISGESEGPPGGHRGRQAVVQVGISKDGWRVSAAGQSSAGSGGASISAGLMKGPLSGSLEVMGLAAAPGIPPAGAAVLQVKWSPVRGSGLEGLFGFADLPAKPELSSRPAVLPGWAGQGVALRGYTRTEAGLVLRALIHLGRHLDRGGERNMNSKLLVDLLASRKPHPSVELSLRFRRDTRRVWEWSERYPWLGPEITATGHRTIVSAQAVYELNNSRARLLVRTYSLEAGTGNGRRSLVGLNGRRDVGHRWIFRVGWAGAWGDPVDLVSAVAPVSGYVLPRHWGQWRSESVLGLEKRAGKLRVTAAVSLRQPEKGIGGGPWPTIWATADIRW